MVKPNIKIYTIVYFTPENYALWKNRIDELAKHYKTKISYDFKEQFFEIVGNSQDACDKSGKKIRILAKFLAKSPNSLLMTEAVDFKFQNRDTLDEEKSVLPSKDYPKSASMKGEELLGLELKGSASIPNSDSDNESDDDDGYILYFIFAKNIKNPYDVLTGPPDNNFKQKDYLKIIGRDTETECSLRDKRKVKIVGSDFKQVEKAFQQFQSLQKDYKSRRNEAKMNSQSENNNKKQPSGILNYYQLNNEWKVQEAAPNEVKEAPDDKPLWGEKGYIENRKETLSFRPDTSWSNPGVTWITPKYNNDYPTLPKSPLEKRSKAHQAKHSNNGSSNKTKKRNE